MTNPISSTYRIQLSPSFRFSDLEDILDYLDDLGITHIYASPIFQPISGSRHGYDTVFYNEINSELGGEDAFCNVSRKAHDLGMGWIQDIVPNHMSADPENHYLRDIFINGRESRYSGMIDLFYPGSAAGSKLKLPLLNADYEASLKSRRIRLSFDDDFYFSIEGLRIPLSIKSAEELLIKKNAGETPLGLCAEVNRNPEKLHRLVQQQNYLPMYWKTLLPGTNYRRFFAVNALIALNTQIPEIFDIIHQKVFNLIHSGYIDGLRVDHIDGLYDPGRYLAKLGEASGTDLVYVEKILARGEEIPRSWNISGTTGYDFNFYCNYLFTNRKNRQEILTHYRKFTGNTRSYMHTVEESKWKFLTLYFRNEVEYLAQIFLETLQSKIYGQEITREGMQECIRELLVHIPVYRTYLSGAHIDERDISTLETALSDSARTIGVTPDLSAIQRLLEEVAVDEKAMFCFARLQQFMPAVLAKSSEDSAFFIYNALISLNEVGGDPSVYSVSKSEFHQFNRNRTGKLRYSMNALSTHDTKLGEDLRSRICAISNMPEEWNDFLNHSSLNNSKYRSMVDGKKTPSPNEEYLIYQLLLAASPENWNNRNFKERIFAQVLKSVREGGINSEWNRINEHYEDGVRKFLTGIMDDEKFRKIFSRVYQMASADGTIISACQNVLKLTAPGIPDTYRGSESMNLSFTDPDNRSEVDFDELKSRLSAIKNSLAVNDLGTILENTGKGDLKIAIHYLLQNFRRAHQKLFMDGDYVEIKEIGKNSGRLFTFALVDGKEWFIVSVIINAKGIMAENGISPDVVKMAETRIVLPEAAPEKFLNLFTRSRISSNGSIDVAEGMGILPFMVIYSGEAGVY